MTPDTPPKRKGTLGLLTGPLPETGMSKWIAVDTDSGEELARFNADSEQAAVTAATEQTGRAGGFTIKRIDPEDGQPINATARVVARPPALPARKATEKKAAPAKKATAKKTATAKAASSPLLPRRRSRRPAKDKLTTTISVAVLDGLADLVVRKDSHVYVEVEEALRTHLEREGIQIEEE